VFENRFTRRMFGLKKDGLLEGRENCMTKSFIILLFSKYYYSDQNKGIQDGEPCSMDERNEKFIQICGQRT
jgi:hypothetical protein